MFKFYIKLVIILSVLLFQTKVISGAAGKDTLSIKNQKVNFSIQISDLQVTEVKLATTKNWAKENYSAPSEYSINNDFQLDVFWTYWNAPDKVNNSDLQLYLTEKDFRITDYEVNSDKSGAQTIVLYEESPEYNFHLKIEYLLEKDAFFVKKKITISDSEYETHFLQNIHTINSTISGFTHIIKKGGYGQPAAFATKNGGGFIGVEYPTSTTEIDSANGKVTTSEAIAQKISSKGISGSWTVLGITPRENVKYWFMKYLNSVRVAELKPYTLYNSWYDLRSVEYPNVPPKYWMNEKNVFRIIDEIKTNFIKKHGIHIDAFVLDDGWDIYESDWKLRTKQFPNGMLPISKKLEEINSTLGMWFGPTGGYSFRLKRINWMKAHGYEVVGTHGDWQPMMCIAGKNYHKLFKKRVTDFVKNAHVGYYKWDGIQFSCSEPDHGHPIGEYSRRAVMDSVIDICNSVRELNPDIFLNITSGTWLSPWWVKYANTIWMQGGDYGYSDVPSISRRDRAITYRDITLYNDLTKYNLWFPISNLMTHGIIKGELQKLGGESEPIDKFTDNAILYFARGVAMYELYISPDILTNNEWDALAQSLKWGKANFDILMNTEMLGGNPANSEAYGFAHFSKNKAIIAVRNPKIEKDTIQFTLSADYGLDKNAANLVMEQVYPRNVFSKKTFNCGDEISVPLDGFETAIFSFYPIEEADKPVISNVDFIKQKDGTYLLSPVGEKIKNLSQEENITIVDEEKNLSANELINAIREIPMPEQSSAEVKTISSGKYNVKLKRNKSTVYSEIAVLFKADENSKGLPSISFETNNGKIETKVVNEKDKWEWVIARVKNGIKTLGININSGATTSGKMSFHLLTYETPQGKQVSIASEIKSQRVYPPRPFPDGLIKKETQIKKFRIGIN